jgi:hypothetical protein
MRSMAFALFERARLLLGPTSRWGTFTTPQTSLHAADRPFDPPRFAPRLSTTHGGFSTEDLGVSSDRAHTGWLP